MEFTLALEFTFSSQLYDSYLLCQAPLFFMSHTPHILENPALITTLIHSFSSYYTHSLYIINRPASFDLYIYTVVPII